MEELLANFSNIYLPDWNIVSKYQSNSKQLLVVNLLTNSYFILKTLHFTKQHTIQQVYDCYRARAAYTLPATPRIMLSNIYFTKQNNCLYQLLVQKSSVDPQQFIKELSIVQFIIALKGIVLTLIMLVHKYGCFKITKKMLGVSSNQLIIWINQDYGLNCIQFRDDHQFLCESNERRCILNLITIISVMSTTSQHQRLLNFLRKNILNNLQLKQKQFIETLQNYLMNQNINRSIQNDISKQKVPTFLKTLNRYQTLRTPVQSISANLQNYQYKVNPSQKMLKSAQLISSSLQNNIERHKDQVKNKKNNKGNKHFPFIKSSSSQYLLPQTIKNKVLLQFPQKSMSYIHNCNNSKYQQQFINVQPNKKILGSTASGSVRATCTAQNLKIQKKMNHYSSKLKINQDNKIRRILKKTQGKQRIQESELTFGLSEVENDIHALLEPSQMHIKDDQTLQKQFWGIQDQFERVLL